MNNLTNNLASLNYTLLLIRNNKKLHHPQTENYKKYIDIEIALLDYQKYEINKYL